MIKVFFSFAILALLGLSQAQAEDLVKAYELAFQNDPQLRAARATLNSIRETRPQALARLLPTIAASGSADHIKPNPKGTSIFSVTDSYETREFSLSLNQPLYHRDYWIQLQQSDQQIAQAEAEYVAEEQNLIIRISRAYFDVLSAQDTLEFAQAEKAAIGRQLDQARQRFDVGLIAITSVHEAQAAFDKARADEILAENEVDNALEALHEIIGGSSRVLAPLTARLPLDPPDPMDISQWSETALQQNPALVALRSATAVARQNIETQRSGHYPTLDLVGSHTMNRTGASNRTDSDTSTIGLQLNVPLYSGGGVTSRTRQARYDFEVAQENLDQQRRAVKRQVRDAYRGVVSSISRVKALEAATVSARSALEATEAGFEVGTRTMVEVLAEQRDLYRAQRDYARVRYDYILNGLLLKQAAGSLSQLDLEKVNGWLK